MTRTFSKIYGLAGIRLGWCYAPLDVCDAINRIRGPFNTNGGGDRGGGRGARGSRPCRKGDRP